MFIDSPLHNKCPSSKCYSLSDDANSDSQDSVVQDIEFQITLIKQQNECLKLKMKHIRQCQKSKEQFIKNTMQSLGFISNAHNQSNLNQTDCINNLNHAIKILQKKKIDSEAELNSLLDNDELWKSREMEADAINLYEESKRLNAEKLKEQQFFNTINQNIEYANGVMQATPNQKQEIKKLKQEIKQLEEQLKAILQKNQKRIPKSSLKPDILQSQISHFQSTLTAETISTTNLQGIIQEGYGAMNHAIDTCIIQLTDALDSLNNQ